MFIGDLSVALSFKNVLLEANIPCVYDVYVCFQPGPTSEPVELSHDPNLPSSISSFRIEVETNEVSTEFVPYVPRICLKDLKVACTACACANTNLSGPTLWAQHKSFGCCHMPSLEWLIAADVRCQGAQEEPTIPHKRPIRAALSLKLLGIECLRSPWRFQSSL